MLLSIGFSLISVNLRCLQKWEKVIEKIKRDKKLLNDLISTTNSYNFYVIGFIFKMELDKGVSTINNTWQDRLRLEKIFNVV